MLPRTEHAFEDITTEEAIKRAIHDGNPIVEVLTLVWKQARRGVESISKPLKKVAYAPSDNDPVIVLLQQQLSLRLQPWWSAKACFFTFRSVPICLHAS